MKENRRYRVNLRVKFSLLALAGSVVSTLLSYAALWVISVVFHVTLGLPLVVWLLIFSFVIGAVITVYMERMLFRPVSRLGAAMGRVAEGDFSMQLECKSGFKEMKEIYSNFNLMVRELSNTETLQTDFVSGVSHEFKTPINAIEGYASLLQDSQLSPEEQSVYVEKILFNTRRLSSLVGNILLLSRLTNQSIQVKTQRYRLDEQIRQAIVALEHRWDEKQIDLDVDLDELEFCGCESLMSHVWLNLIENAIKFDPVGGFIKMRLKEQGGRIIFTIADSGPGIAEDEQSRIFGKFYQSDTSRKSEGNGLGLALVKWIVDDSGGTISVKSKPGEGAVFTVSLPAADPEVKL